MPPRGWTEDIIDEHQRRHNLGKYNTGDIAHKAPDEAQKIVDQQQKKYEAKQEKELQGLCEQELNRRGVTYLHLSPRAREKKGWPDLCFSLQLFTTDPTPAPRAYPIAVELKTSTGSLSDDQVDCLRGLALDGWVCRVIRSYRAFLDLLHGNLQAGEDCQ